MGPIIFRGSRTGGRVVEGTGLENRRTGNGIESSNLSLSVTVLRPAHCVLRANGGRG